MLMRSCTLKGQCSLVPAVLVAVAILLTLWATTGISETPTDALYAEPIAEPAMEASLPPGFSPFMTFPEDNKVPAPDFALPTSDGKTFRLSDQVGKVVVLNFWATWCPPCRAEIPDFIKLQNELGERGLVIAGVSLDEEGWEVVRPFAEEFQFNYPVMVDDGAADDAYGPIAALPTTFLIDREGMVRHYAPGMLTEEMLRPVLMDLLEEE